MRTQTCEAYRVLGTQPNGSGSVLQYVMPTVQHRCREAADSKHGCTRADIDTVCARQHRITADLADHHLQELVADDFVRQLRLAVQEAGDRLAAEIDHDLDQLRRRQS